MMQMSRLVSLRERPLQLKINNAKVFSYADDTAVIFSRNAEMGMTQIAEWLSHNLLTHCAKNDSQHKYSQSTQRNV